MANRTGAPTQIDLRIGTDEREACVASLQEHFAAGRLEVDEVDARIHQALRATTAADLDVLVSDLPRQATKRRGPGPVSKRAWWSIAAATLGVGAVLGIGSVVGGISTPAAVGPSVFCESTGQGSEGFCPVVSDTQRRLLLDLAQAQDEAQQLEAIASEHADRPQLKRMSERAELLAGRAEAAGLRSQELVRADADLPEKSLTDLAATARTSAAEIEKLLDEATAY